VGACACRGYCKDCSISNFARWPWSYSKLLVQVFEDLGSGISRIQAVQVHDVSPHGHVKLVCSRLYCITQSVITRTPFCNEEHSQSLRLLHTYLCLIMRAGVSTSQIKWLSACLACHS